MLGDAAEVKDAPEVLEDAAQARLGVPQVLRMRLAGAEGKGPEPRGRAGRSWLWKLQRVGLGGTQNRGRCSGVAAGAAPSQGR